MPQALAVIQTKSPHGRHRLKRPETEIAAFFQRVFYRITIDIPPKLITIFAAQSPLELPPNQRRERS